MNKLNWISVNDELPPIGKRVYVKRNHRDKRGFIAMRFMEGNGWVWRDERGVHVVNVESWSKIPRGMA